jgi:hypothetical protein
MEGCTKARRTDSQSENNMHMEKKVKEVGKLVKCNSHAM